LSGGRPRCVQPLRRRLGGGGPRDGDPPAAAWEIGDSDLLFFRYFWPVVFLSLEFGFDSLFCTISCSFTT
jgi:hypothetical protein